MKALNTFSFLYEINGKNDKNCIVDACICIEITQKSYYNEITSNEKEEGI